MAKTPTKRECDKSAKRESKKAVQDHVATAPPRGHGMGRKK